MSEEKEVETVLEAPVGFRTKVVDGLKGGKVAVIRETNTLDEINAIRILPKDVRQSDNEEYVQMMTTSLMLVMSILEYNGKDHNYWIPNDSSDFAEKLIQIPKADFNKLLKAFVELNSSEDFLENAQS